MFTHDGGLGKENILYGKVLPIKYLFIHNSFM